MFKRKNVAIQIAEQIVAGFNRSDLKNCTRDKKDVTKHIVKSLVASINAVPFLNIGEIANGFMEAIDETIDVDMDHISDYKIEKAIINVIQKFERKNNTKKICLLIDDTSKLSPVSLEFISKIMEHSFSRILFTIPRNYDINGIEALSKLSYIESFLMKLIKCLKDQIIDLFVACLNAIIKHIKKSI